ncbi:hypothetical protein ACIGZJ_27865 [Kitasatospora sp. NPDC052868]|uniref:hypothetical protein n=1 Tax=Kitasatospora sp. NPDC052868 TaxID=3364060 RepID=UPI0037C93B77
MKRLAAVLTAAAALAVPTTAVQEAAAAPAGPVGATVTCGTPGAPGFLLTRACVEVTGNQVNLYGQATPTNPAWQPQQVGFTLAGNVVGNAPIAPVSTSVLVSAGGVRVGGIATTAPCGATVTASFAVSQWGWPPSTATVSAVVAC